MEDGEDDYILTKELFEEFPPGAYTLDRVADYDSAVHAFTHCALTSAPLLSSS